MLPVTRTLQTLQMHSVDKTQNKVVDKVLRKVKIFATLKLLKRARRQTYVARALRDRHELCQRLSARCLL